MKFTERELVVIQEVFGELLRMPNSKLNTLLGTETIDVMSKIHHKLEYSNYCEKHGKKYEELTEEDYIEAIEEMEI